MDRHQAIRSLQNAEPCRQLALKLQSEKEFTQRSQRSQGNGQPRIEGDHPIPNFFATFAISVCKNPIRKGDPHGDRKDGRNGQLRIEGDHPIPNWSLRPLRSLRVKIRSEKAIHPEIAKITKERTTTDRRGHPIPNWSLRPLRSLCVKIRSEKAIHTEIAKITKERTTTDRRGHPIPNCLCDLCDLCV